jgi:hypothetical protein
MHSPTVTRTGEDIDASRPSPALAPNVTRQSYVAMSESVTEYCPSVVVGANCAIVYHVPPGSRRSSVIGRWLSGRLRSFG